MSSASASTSSRLSALAPPFILKNHGAAHNIIPKQGMKQPIATSRSGRVSSYERLVAIVLTVVAVFSPLYIDRRAVSDLEDDEQSINLFSWLPLLLLVLIILAIAFSLYFDQSFTRFDP